MGITISYRGRLADLTRVEDFEDRLIDFALEVGGQARVWRSHADEDPTRVVRGVILNVAPGLEPASLLLSPEGWLIGLVDIEDAERGRLTEPPWCFVKTQFGPLEGHVALAEMFAALRDEFLPGLEVSDEGGYYLTRDLAELTRRHSLLRQAIAGLAEGLRRHGLSREAAEDPDILARHVERVAAQVHRVLQRPAEHPPVTDLEDEDCPGVMDPEATEALWDERFRHNRRQQERLQRALEERLIRGEEDEEAFEGALEDLGLEAPDEEPGEGEEPWDEAAEPGTDLLEGDVAADEEGDAEDEPFEAERERHPLLRAAMGLLEHVQSLFRDRDERRAPSLHALLQGAGDVMGGLAQAVSRRADADDPAAYGLQVTQLKRALRGVAFARGALFALRAAVTAEQFDELYRTLGKLEQDVFAELGRVRSERQADDS